MKKTYVKITAALCALILLLTCQGCAVRVVKIEPDAVVTPAPTQLPAEVTPDVSPDVTPDVTPGTDGEEELPPHGLTAFDEMEYSHPDFEGAKAHIEQIHAMLDSEADADEIYESYEALQDEFCEFYTQYCLLTVQCSIDVTDAELADERETLAGEYYGLVALSRELDARIYGTDYRDTVFADWTDRELERLEVTSRLTDDEYVELSTRADEIGAEYWDIVNGTTVGVTGNEYTRESLPESGLPEEIQARLLERCYEKLNDRLGELYLELIGINNRIAEKAGFDSYPEYAYAVGFTRDYTPEDADALCGYVKTYLPAQMEALVGCLSGEEYQGLYEATMASGQLTERQDVLENYAREISPEMHDAFEYLIDRRLSVITDSDVCEGGAYTVFLETYNSPVMYINLVGGYQDVLTFIHEFGHFYGFYENGSDNVNYSSLDVLEIMSQAGELLFMPYFEDYMDEATFSAIKKSQMFDTLYNIMSSCIYDEFQRYAYTHDIQTVEELNAAFADISRSYGIDESFYAVPLEYVWIDVEHSFSSPLYYISYAASLIPSFEIFELSNSDREAAIDLYNAIVHSDSHSTFRQVLDEAGLASPFEEETIVNIAAAVNSYLG